MTDPDTLATIQARARGENAMGYREAAAFLVGRATSYDGPHQEAVYAFAYRVHEELMDTAKRIDRQAWA